MEHNLLTALLKKLNDMSGKNPRVAFSVILWFLLSGPISLLFLAEAIFGPFEMGTYQLLALYAAVEMAVLSAVFTPTSKS